MWEREGATLVEGRGENHFPLKCTKSNKNIYTDSLIVYSIYTREGNGFSPLSSTKVTQSLSHSPLPVLPIFKLHGLIRHSGAILLESRFKKPNSLLLDD